MVKRALTCLMVVTYLACASAQDVNDKTGRLSIVEAINYLENEFQVDLSFSSALIKDFNDDLSVDGTSLWQILDDWTDDTSLEYYKLSSSRILLRDAVEANTKENSFSTIEVYVFDQKTLEPLELVGVGIEQTAYGQYTDQDGVALIKIESNTAKARLIFELLGYKKSYIDIGPGLSMVSIGLETDPIKLEEVSVIDRKNRMSQSELNQATILSFSNVTGITSGLVGNDIMRQIQLMPGITADNDASSGIKIRGGKEDETLIVLDGIPIYNASHYHGIFSSINSAHVDMATLYKNNIPVEFGGKTSGMVDLRSNSSITENETKGNLDIDLLTASLSVKHALSDKAAFLVSGRTSYANASESVFSNLFDSEETDQVTVQNFSDLTRAVLLNSTPNFRFHDINAKFIYEATTKTKLDFNLYTSGDLLSDSYNNQFGSRGPNGLVVINNERYSNSENWNNLGASINLMSETSEKSNVKSTLYFTKYRNEGITTAGLTRRFGPEIRSNESENIRDNTILDIGFKTAYAYKLSKETEITAGIDFQHHEVDFEVNERTGDVLGLATNGNEYAAFAEAKYQIDGLLITQLGLRATYYDVSNQVQYAPRISFTSDFNQHLKLKASYGRHYQFVRELNFENLFGRTSEYWVLGGRNTIPVAKSNNFMIGSSFLTGRFQFDIEAYYRDRKGVIEFALINPPFDEESVQANGQNRNNQYGLFVGDGETRGVDMSATYNGKRYYSSFTYTLAKSENSFKGILGRRPFPAQDDRRHRLKWINEFSIQNLSISANIVYSSGRPYTDISNLMANLRRDELTPEQRISRLPHYARLDLGVYYKFRLDQNDLNLGLSVYNLMNRTNVSYLQYIFSIPIQNQQRQINTIIGTQTTQLPRTLNLSLGLSF